MDGADLIATRKRLGYNKQKQAAVVLGIYPHTISDIEKNKVRLLPSEYKRLADELAEGAKR